MHLQEENMDKMMKVISPVIYTHVKFSLDLSFCMQFIFDVFSTVMSPKDVLSLCMGRMQEHL